MAFNPASRHPLYLASRKRREDLAVEYLTLPNMAELARRHGITRERVRQLLKSAGVDLTDAKSRAKQWQKTNRQEKAQ